MVTIAGGKWTTYRRMAEDVIDRAIEAASLEARACRTHELRLHGWVPREAAGANPKRASDGATARGATEARRVEAEVGASPALPPEWSLVFGSDRPALEVLLAERPEWREPMDARAPYPLGLAAWAVRHESALHLEDVLARRTRMLLLDARAAMTCAERVARVMAEELGRDESWVADEVNAFVELARGYVV